MPEIEGRLGYTVPVDMVVENAIIHPDSTIVATIVEPGDQYGQKVEAKHIKLMSEEGAYYAVTSKGKLGLINRVEHQGYNHVDLRK